jgi:hypothetical protein
MPDPIVQEVDGGLTIILSIERHIEAGLDEGLGQQFALAGAVINLENGGMGHHRRSIQRIRKGVSAGNVPGVKKKIKIDE